MLPLRQQAEDILTEVDQLESRLHDLRNYAHPPMHGPASVQLSTVFDDTVQQFATALAHHRVRLQQESLEALPPLRIDPTLLRQVCHTVIANALDAMPHGGTLTIQAALTADQRHVQLQIRDTGHEMTPDQLASVFRPFFTTKRRGLGIGLALAIPWRTLPDHF